MNPRCGIEVDQKKNTQKRALAIRGWEDYCEAIYLNLNYIFLNIIYMFFFYDRMMLEQPADLLAQLSLE